MGIAGKSSEMRCTNCPRATANTCAHTNVQSASGGEKAADVTNAEGAHKQKKKQCRTFFCPKVLVGDDLEKAMAGYQSVGRTSSVDGSAQCWTCEGCTGVNPPSAQRCLVEGCGLEQVEPSVQEPTPSQPVAVVDARNVSSKKKSSAKKSGNKKGNATNGGRCPGFRRPLIRTSVSWTKKGELKDRAQI